MKKEIGKDRTALLLKIGLLGNHEIVNALLTGAFSLGNIRFLTGHLLMPRRAEKNLSERA